MSKYWTKPWNPIVGIDGRPHCTKVSDECLHCWASNMNIRFGGGEYNYKDRDFKWAVKKDVLRSVLVRSIKKQPQIYFVQNNMDLFHESIPMDGYNEFFSYMLGAHSKSRFLILTKRPKKMVQVAKLIGYSDNNKLWWGVSCGSQEHIWRIECLMQINGNKWVSVEPILGPVDFISDVKYHGLNWVIVGCESGPNRRPCELSWVRDLRDQCRELGIAFFVKQLSIDGKVVSDINKFPSDLQLREMPV